MSPKSKGHTVYYSEGRSNKLKGVKTNEKGEIINFIITQGNVDDKKPLENLKFIDKIKGKLYADKGYISARLTQLLFIDGIQLINEKLLT